MPRKKKQEQPEPAVEAGQEPKPRTRASKKAEESAATPVQETAAKAAPAKRTRKAKEQPQAEPAPAVEETPKAEKPARSPRAKKQPKPEEAAPTSVPEPETKPAPAKTRRGGKTAPKASAPSVTEELGVEFRSSTRKPAAAAPALSPAPPAPEESREQRGRRGRNVRERKQAAPKSVDAPRESRTQNGPEPFIADYDESEGLPILEWRPRPQGRGEETTGIAPRRSKGRRRPDREEPITAAAAVEMPEVTFRGRPGKDRAPKPEPKVQPEPPKPVQETKPEPPPKPLIPTPDDAPQVVVREGVPTLVRKGRVYPPIAFFGSSPDESRAATVVEEIKMAGEAGVHIHSHLIDFDVDRESVSASVSFAAYMLKQSLKADPEAQVLFRIVFHAPQGWTDKYRDARYLLEDGSLAEPSLNDDRFWGEARDCLASFIRQIRKLPDQEHILGVHLERGEWFFPQGSGYDTSFAAKKKFTDWAQARYQGDIVALRAAWFDGSVSFDTLPIPQYQPEGKAGEEFVRSNRKGRPWVDYHLFLSDAAVHRIGDLAYAAKEASEGYFLVGASYGYTFEWSHPDSGHLSLGKLLRTPEIDFIAGPPSYRSREPGGAAPFPGPIDSFAINGKLYISEEDFKTSISNRYEPDDFNPVIKTPQALDSVHWRGVGSALAHGSGMCWMDLWGNGWLKTHSVWDRAKRVQSLLTKRLAASLSDPDVAVFIDERALAYLVDQKAFALLVQNVRESVLRSGLSCAFYLLSDLQHREKFPESKLYVFLNAWDIRPDLRLAIKNRLQRDNKVLFWLYAAALFDSGRESVERAREVTGIAIKPQPFHSRPGTTIINRRHPLCEHFPDKGVIGGAKLEPSYFAIPEEAQVLGEYTQTGLPSFVTREFKHDSDPSLNWKSVFLGEPVVTPGLIRALGQYAGAHVWNYQEDVVHVRAPFLTVHCTGTGPRTITLPSKWSAYNLTTESWAATDTTSLRFNANDGTTHLFLVGVKEELDAILNADPDDLLKMDVLPPKPDNTVRFDGFSFDVPIMKLDEWIEGGAEADDLAEDLLFRPRLLEEVESSEDDQSGRGGRRRRRRGSRDRDERPRENRRETTAVVDFGMDVVFRKRGE